MTDRTRDARPSRRLAFICGAAAAALAVYSWGDLVVRPYVVPTSSMEPTLRCSADYDGCSGASSDRLLVVPLVYRLRGPRRGEIVVFSAPDRATRVCAGGYLIKRIVGIAGDVVTVDADGATVTTETVAPRRPQRARLRRQVKLGAGEYFVVGDNRGASCDSRNWGPVARSEIIGPALLRYWPLERLGRP